jgi:hypothetical protein
MLMTLLFQINVYAALGWIGTLSYLLAYLLLSVNKLKSTQISYHALNIVGSVGLVANAMHYADLPNIVVNIAWGVIAIVAIIAFSRKRVKQN